MAAADVSSSSTPQAWHQLIGIDLRSLALFRIGMALTILVSMSSFWFNITMFLSDKGVYPRPVIMMERPSEAFSLFFISGRYEVIFVLMCIFLLAVLAMLFGYYTRIATVVCWIFLTSLDARTSVFLSGADKQLAVMLFWAMFLPLGARFSIDRALSREPKPDQMVVSAASLALLLQVTYLYLMGALVKTGDAWLIHHTAVLDAVSNRHLSTIFSDYLAQWPLFTKWLTIFVYNIELYAVFFLFFPLWNAVIRMVMFLLLASMHFGFFVFLDVSFFPLVSIVGLTIFIPGFFWVWLKNRLDRYPKLTGFKIYYDEPCGFCRKVCLIFRELSFNPSAYLNAAQTDPEIHKILVEQNSWVVKTGDGRTLTRWEAVTYIWRRSPILLPLGLLFMIPGMPKLGEVIYEWIARNRGRLGDLTGKYLPYRSHVAVRPSLINNILMVPLMIVTLLINLHNIEEYKKVPIPRFMADILNYTRLGQHWSMFAPWPSKSSTWVVVEGFLPENEVVDLLWAPGQAPSYVIPNLGSEAYPSRRWHKFFSHLNWKRNGVPVGSAFCRLWVEAGNRVPLERVVVTQFMQKNMPGAPKNTWPIRQVTLLDYDCRTRKARPPQPSIPVKKDGMAPEIKHEPDKEDPPGGEMMEEELPSRPDSE